MYFCRRKPQSVTNHKEERQLHLHCNKGRVADSTDQLSQVKVIWDANLYQFRWSYLKDRGSWEITGAFIKVFPRSFARQSKNNRLHSWNCLNTFSPLGLVFAGRELENELEANP